MFKHISIKPFASFINLVVASATRSERVEAKQLGRVSSFSFLATAVLAIAAGSFAMTGASAVAGNVGQNISPGLEVVESFDPFARPGIGCPCDLKSAVYLAGWTGPVCEVDTSEFPTAQITLRSGAGATSGDLIPSVILFTADAGLCNDCRCRVINDQGVPKEEFSDLTADEFASCLADLNALALVLGRRGGCSTEDFDG